MTNEKPLGAQQWLVLAAAFLGWMFDGVEIGLFPLVARPALQELLADVGDADVGRWNGIIGACFLLGAAAGGLAFGWLGDRVGRVRAMAAATLTYSLFTGAAAFATAAWQLAVLRFIASLGMGGEWAVAVALVVECWPDRHRPKLAGAIGAAANFGFLLIACVAYVFPVTAGSWRWMLLLGASPAVLALLILVFVPESQRWREARKTAVASPLAEIFSRGVRKTLALAIVLSAVPLIGTWAAVSGWVPLWAEQLVEAQATARAAGVDGLPPGDAQALQAAREKLSPADRTAVMIDAARAKAGIQVWLAIGAIVGCFAAPIVGGVWGRRPVYFGLCLLSLLSCAFLFRVLTEYDLLFLATVGFVGAVTAAFYGWLPLYLPELFPTRVRATAQGLSFNFGRILAAAGALQMGELVRMLGGNYAAAGASITLIYAVGLAVIWLSPETKGRPLPD